MKKLKFVISIFILCSLVVFCGNMDNKRTKNISESDVVVVSTNTLYSDYHANEVRADNIYKGKYLKLTGTVDEIRKDFMDNIVITLQTENMFMSIHCTILKEFNSRAANLTKGSTITIIGKCEGMIIGSVMLDDCLIK